MGTFLLSMGAGLVVDFRVYAMAVGLGCSAMPAIAQSPTLATPAPATATAIGAIAAPTSLYTDEDLARRATALRNQAMQSGQGSASVVLERYPGHFTMLGFRNASGLAEEHASSADIDVILDGSATLISGGTMTNPRTTGPGELRGPSILGGQTMQLHKGDIVHIPAGSPHQMLLAPNTTLTYFVIKAETPGGK